MNWFILPKYLSYHNHNSDYLVIGLFGHHKITGLEFVGISADAQVVFLCKIQKLLVSISDGVIGAVVKDADIFAGRFYRGSFIIIFFIKCW